MIQASTVEPRTISVGLGFARLIHQSLNNGANLRIHRLIACQSGQTLFVDLRALSGVSVIEDVHTAIDRSLNLLYRSPLSLTR